MEGRESLLVLPFNMEGCALDDHCARLRIREPPQELPRRFLPCTAVAVLKLHVILQSRLAPQCLIVPPAKALDDLNDNGNDVAGKNVKAYASLMNAQNSGMILSCLGSICYMVSSFRLFEGK